MSKSPLVQICSGTPVALAATTKLPGASPMDDPFARDFVEPASVTADQFLTEIFFDIPGRVVLCRPAGGGFTQQFWEPGLCATLRPGCWYFCIGTVHGLAEDGTVRRRKGDLHRLGASCSTMSARASRARP